MSFICRWCSSYLLSVCFKTQPTGSITMVLGMIPPRTAVYGITPRIGVTKKSSSCVSKKPHHFCLKSSYMSCMFMPTKAKNIESEIFYRIDHFWSSDPIISMVKSPWLSKKAEILMTFWKIVHRWTMSKSQVFFWWNSGETIRKFRFWWRWPGFEDQIMKRILHSWWTLYSKPIYLSLLNIAWYNHKNPSHHHHLVWLKITIFCRSSLRSRATKAQSNHWSRLLKGGETGVFSIGIWVTLQ